MRDDSYLQLRGRLMDSIKQQVAAAVTRGATLEQTRKNVNLDEYRKLFAGDSKVRNTLFSVYVVRPAVEKLCLKSRKHCWIGSGQGAGATWSVISMRYFLAILIPIA